MNKVATNKKMNSLTKYKEKLVYTSQLLFKAPSIYHTFKKMSKNPSTCSSNVNTAQTSIVALNQSSNYSTLSKNQAKHKPINRPKTNDKKFYIPKYNPKFSYMKYFKTKIVPFDSNEPRFKWQDLTKNNYPKCINNLNKIAKDYYHAKCFYFQNGFKGFYSSTSKAFDLPIQKRQKKSVLSPLNNNTYDKTKRVIFPSSNNENNDYLNKRHKKPSSLKRYNSYDNLGGLRNLYNKTPINKNKKEGIKIVKRDHSYDLNLFREDYGQIEYYRKKRYFEIKDSIVFGYNINKSVEYKSNIKL